MKYLQAIFWNYVKHKVRKKSVPVSAHGTPRLPMLCSSDKRKLILLTEHLLKIIYESCSHLDAGLIFVALNYLLLIKVYMSWCAFAMEFKTQL